MLDEQIAALGAGLGAQSTEDAPGERQRLFQSASTRQMPDPPKRTRKDKNQRH